jgi:aspartate dehydrogenase
VKKIALIGYGAIGRSIVDRIIRFPIPGVQLVAVMMRRSQLGGPDFGVPNGVLATDNLGETLNTGADTIIEAAGQGAVKACGHMILGNGREFMVLSVGALAHDELRESLTREAIRGGGRIGIPSGALAGFDGLMAMREIGLTSVTYRATKPVEAWRGTSADFGKTLDQIRESTVIFSGSAKDAAIGFPKNANLAVAVAIAGVGLERTKVELVADPNTRSNVGHLVARGAKSELVVTVTNSGFESNPKSSQITGLSVISALSNRSALIQYQ